MSERNARFGWSPGDDEEKARRALCRLGRHLYMRGLVAGSAGNVSLGLDQDALLVTPRGVHKAFMREAELVRLALSSPADEAVRRASTELPFHLAAHRAMDGHRVVLHTHAPALTALGVRARVATKGRATVPGPLGGEDGLGLLNLLPELGIAVGPVALVPFHPSGSESLGKAVGDAVRAGARVLLLQRHGVVSVGATIEDALDRTELAELGAHAALLAGREARVAEEDVE